MKPLVCVSDSVSSETAFLEDYVLGMGDTLEMTCDMEDHAEPVVWFKDGAVLASSNRTRVGQRILRIINVSYEDSGVYSCRLARSNVLLSNYTIRVTGEPGAGQRVLRGPFSRFNQQSRPRPAENQPLEYGNMSITV